MPETKLVRQDDIYTKPQTKLFHSLLLEQAPLWFQAKATEIILNRNLRKYFAIAFWFLQDVIDEEEHSYHSLQSSLSYCLLRIQ